MDELLMPSVDYDFGFIERLLLMLITLGELKPMLSKWLDTLRP